MAIKEVQTTCAYCASGCQIGMVVDTDRNQILEAKALDGRTNRGKLCLKGYYGWDYLNDPQILTKRIQKPMIRKNGKNSRLEEVEWDEAIRFVAEHLNKIKEQYGPDAIMGTASARGPGNEAGYLMQKFMRACVGTNNIDHCARVCHAASVVGCQASIGEGAMSLGVPEIEDASVIFNIGYNAATSHPIVAARIVKAKQKGCKIICIDPRVTETARIADVHLQLKGGTNLALTNAIAHVIIEENLIDQEFIANNTKNFEEYKKVIETYTPEYSADICGVDADDIKKAARIYANSRHSVILWGMGITQFRQGVSVVESCCNLAMMTGNFGRRSTGVGPVRGQNNVQGTCDMGDLPNQYPGYQNVTDPEVRKKFEEAWGVKLSDQIGVQLTRVPELVLKEKDPNKQIHAYYIFGEDPIQSDPHGQEIRQAIASVDFVIVQDCFHNRTSAYADVILPSTAWGEHEGVYTSCDRGFQRVRKCIEPTGDVKTDCEIICLVSTAMGYPMSYEKTEDIWNEMIDLCPKFTGATYEKMDLYGGVQWPCYSKDLSDKGTPYLHKGGKFAHPDGKGVFIGVDYEEVYEKEGEEYPFSLSTVREVGHYSVRTMTGNCRMLRSLEDEPGWVEVNVEDCKELNLKKGELVWVTSKRGHCMTRCLPTERVAKGSIYMTYQWWIGACNELTIGQLDMQSKTPEYKYCACRIEKIEDQEWAKKYVDANYKAIRMEMGIDIRKKEG
ncbi:MAG: formate dehydrogenase subunit alpha [Clostridia bacterium]|nr:formate dehydrogenase subunit alpha [Clostridia bacterium]